MNKRAVEIGAVFVLISQFCASAAVVPMLIRLESVACQTCPTDYVRTFTVPADKVLIIDAYRGDLEIVAENGDIFRLTSVSLYRGVKIPSSTLLRCLALKGNTDISTNTASVFGSLVDVGDLYARAVPNILEITPVLENGMVSLTAFVGMETITRVEKTDDIRGDSWMPVATFASGIAEERTTALAEGGAMRGFYRLRTLSRQY